MLGSIGNDNGSTPVATQPRHKARPRPQPKPAPVVIPPVVPNPSAPPAPPKPVVKPPPKPVQALPRAGERAERYAQAALLSARNRVATAGNGGRNHCLNKETYAVARFIGEGLLTTARVADYMAAAGAMAGLGEREIQATIASALRAAGAL